MSKKKEWAVGDLVAWESQAQGSFKSKVGRITALPVPGAKLSTSAGKYQLDVIGSYPVRYKKDVGTAVGIKLKAGSGRANLSALRELSVKERAAIASKQ